MPTMKVGVVGYCPPTRFDDTEARRMVVDAYDQIATQYQDREITIVSGLTNVGVLQIAYEEAEKRGWKTIGIACEKANEHPLFPVDEKIIVGQNWGDESQVFLDSIDAIVRIGTGPQSLRETAVVKQAGKPTYEYELPTL